VTNHYQTVCAREQLHRCVYRLHVRKLNVGIILRPLTIRAITAGCSTLACLPSKLLAGTRPNQATLAMRRNFDRLFWQGIEGPKRFALSSTWRSARLDEIDGADSSRTIRNITGDHVGSGLRLQPTVDKDRGRKINEDQL